MSVFRKILQGLVIVSALGFFCWTSARAEEPPVVADAAFKDSSSLIAETSDETAATPAAGAPQSSANSPATPPADETHDNQWHYLAMAYLWVPQIHGTTGVRGFDTNVHVTASDLFSNFRGGILGVFTPSFNRFSAPIDFMWMRIRPSTQIPFDPSYSLRATINMSIATPKVAYLILNNPKIKIYGTMGPRIWHEGTTLTLVPTVEGHSAYQGVTWTDFVAGGRFAAPLGPKLSVDVGGDAGEGAATLDYQVFGFVNYQLKPKLSMQAGWRYLTVHYGNNGNVFNSTIQGVAFGATYKFK